MSTIDSADLKIEIDTYRTARKARMKAAAALPREDGLDPYEDGRAEGLAYKNACEVEDDAASALAFAILLKVDAP